MSSTAPGWALETSRTDLSDVVLVEEAVPEPQDGEAVLRVDRVGVTANNVTYGVLGEAFRYWEFFPADSADRGRVPLWGFAEVVASRADGVEVGARYYGYLPPASHLRVQPARPDAQGFRDASAHRAELPSPYNAYALTTGDPAYSPEEEDLQVLFRPLFFTSFVLADQLGDTDGTVLLSSASSKTAYGTAFLLRRAGRRVVGLTSAGNVAFTQALGCYDEVLSYDDVPTLPVEPSVYADVAGRAALRRALHEHLGSALTADLVVGITHQDGESAGTLGGVRPQVFFAPERMRVRTQDWGREELDRRFAEAWRAFVPSVRDWVDVVVGSGPERLREVWLEVQAGSSAPRTGHVLQL